MRNTNHLKGYLKRHWPKIKQDLLNGVYRPLPVRRKEIDKPDGGVRLLGIPTVLDRLIQHAIAQVLEQIWDPTFSEYSYGFRPGRSAHDAVLQAKGYLLDGYTHVVDMDLSKFFDRVNHDRLMSRLATRIRDKRVLRLIRRYLTAGTMIGGLVSPGIEGTPQAVLYRRCSPTLYSMSWIRNWKSGVINSSDTPTTSGFTAKAGKPPSEWIRASRSSLP